MDRWNMTDTKHLQTFVDSVMEQRTPDTEVSVIISGLTEHSGMWWTQTPRGQSSTHRL